MTSITDERQLELDEALANVTGSVSAASLLDAGANPNAWLVHAPGIERTPIGQALKTQELQAFGVMLRWLMQRGEIPLYQRTETGQENLFDLLAGAAANRGCYAHEKLAMTLMQQVGMPRSWRLEMGHAFLRATETRPISVTVERTATIAQALSLAAFDDKRQWFDLLQRCKPRPALVEELFWQVDARNDFMSVVKQIIADGANMDEIPSNVGINGDEVYTPVTMLQTAVLYQKPDLVKFFVELGANASVSFPDLQTLPQGLRGASTLSAAQTAGTELGQIIASALAKQRVDQVLESARQANKEMAP